MDRKEEDSRSLEILEELLAWTKFGYRGAFVETIRASLKDPKHLSAYEATDGSRSQNDVATIAGLSQSVVSGLWAKWRRQGLVMGRERPRHIAKPSDVGFELPASVTGAKA